MLVHKLLICELIKKLKGRIKMKKLIAFLLALSMIVVFATGCGSTKKTERINNYQC